MFSKPQGCIQVQVLRYLVKSILTSVFLYCTRIKLVGFNLQYMESNFDGFRVPKNHTVASYWTWRKWECFWVDHQAFLLSRGYRLRPRYDPEWIPSWAPNTVPYHCEDAIATLVCLILLHCALSLLRIGSTPTCSMPSESKTTNLFI